MLRMASAANFSVSRGTSFTTHGRLDVCSERLADGPSCGPSRVWRPPGDSDDDYESDLVDVEVVVVGAVHAGIDVWFLYVL